MFSVWTTSLSAAAAAEIPGLTASLPAEVPDSPGTPAFKGLLMGRDRSGGSAQAASPVADES